MKNTIQILFILFLSILSTSIYAQDNRTLDTKVADILAQMPTKDLTHRDEVLQEMLNLGQEGFQKVSQLLVAPGKGDDVAARYVINGMARHASKSDNAEEKEFVEAQLLFALENRSNNEYEVKTFLLNQLNLVGGEKTVTSIKGFLIDGKLCEPTTQTLLAIGGENAASIIFDALGKVDEKLKPTLVKALGELRYSKAVPEITSLVESGNQRTKKTALEALANIGDPASYKALLNAAKNENFQYEPTNATEAFLNYADRLGENNEAKLCKKACKIIFKANQENDKIHNYSKALAIYTKHYGAEALPFLLKSIENPNKAFRYSVLNLAEAMKDKGSTEQWMQKARKASPEIKAEIVDMLGRKGDLMAVDFIRENLNSSSPVVREEAVNALTALQKIDAIPVLVAHLASGKDLEVTESALLRLLNQKNLDVIAEQLEKTSGETKAAMIDLIAAKSGSKYFDEIIVLCNSTNEAERASAYEALKRVSVEKNIDQLIELLFVINNETEIYQVQLALVAAAKDVDEEKKDSGKIITALKETDKKERLISILPEIGGSAGLKIVTDYFNNSDGATKEAAFEALLKWKEFSASASLFEICKAGGKYHEKAFSSFITQVRSANIPDDQKLLQYRKIMPYAKNADEKILVINSIGQLKTYLSLIYLEDFLDDKEFQQSSARAIMKIALPDEGQNNGFSGQEVKGMLEKVATLIKGEESEYDKINIRNYLDKMPKGEGFVSMFNGKNLDGWQGLVGNPITRAKMSKRELAREQKKANEKMLENWSVRDNTIVFNGKGDNLCSIKEYGDFELLVDWRITKKGDSGLYLRGTPQVQVWDTSRVEVGAQVGSGGLYNNQKYESKPLKVADNPIGEWNTFHVTMIGENVTVYLNGELVVDNVPLENYWDRSQPIFEKGPIELQAHGNELAFRDIYVREINTKEIGLTEEEINEGFESLFNGKNLDNWQGNKTDYYAEDGEIIVNPKKGGHGNLYTEKEYSDFIFRFEFQLTPGANNGLGIRTPMGVDAAYHGMELQILDNTASIYANLKKYQYHGSVYGVIPAKRGYLKPIGEWNSEEVIVKGSKVKVILNGEVIVDGDIKEAGSNGTLDGKEHPGLFNAKGYIGFLGHGSELKFRNIRIKDLSE